MEPRLPGLDSLGPALDAAGREGHLPDPGRSLRPEATRNEADSRAYVRALRSRLSALGYLPDAGTARSGIVDTSLKAAIAQFQRDAGLTVDAWAGPRTWRALRQLTGFEDEQDPNHWTGPLADLSPPAVARAAYLRLFALGAIDRDECLGVDVDLTLAPGTPLALGLERFLGWAHELGATDERLQPRLSAEALAVLYGQDDLVRRLAAQDKAFFDGHRGFVESAACVELWLLGFDVDLADRKARTLRGKRRQRKLKLAVLDFWRQQTASARPDGWARGRVTRRLFDRLAQLDASVEQDEARLETELIDMVSDFTAGERQSFVDRLEDLASSIWDGARRVARYLLSLPGRLLKLLRKGKAAALHLLKNAARFVAVRARRAFGTVRGAVEIVHRGVVYLRDRILPGSDPQALVIAHDRDFDLRTFTHADAERAAVRTLVDAQAHAAVVFGAACAILGALAAIAQQVFSAVHGPTGWMLALLALTRLAGHFRTIHEQVQLVRTYRMNTPSPFANPAGRDDDEE